jgi:DNA-binding MarR family transcriptional regulator
MRTISQADLGRDAQRFGDLLRQIGRLRSLREPLIATAAQTLTPPQLHTLMWVGSDGALMMGELARRLGITEKTMTGVVDRLERDGLVRRVRGEKDRRVWRVELTRKGSAVHHKLKADVQQKFCGLMELLDARDREALIRIAETVLLRMKERLPPNLKGTGS